VLLKNKEIASLKDQLKKTGGSIPEEESELEDEDLYDERHARTESAAGKQKRGPPSPD